MWHETSLERHIPLPSGNDAPLGVKVALAAFLAVVFGFGFFVVSRAVEGPSENLNSLETAAGAASSTPFQGNP
jgi:hypothetical protein